MKACLALSAVSIAALLAAGCSSVPEPAASADAKPTREYRTGSNIPVKDPTPTATDVERERAADAIRSMQRTGTTGKPGG